MILVDINLFVYFFNSDDERHEQARGWLERVLSTGEAILVPWESIVGFTRVITLPHRRLSPSMLRAVLEEFFSLFRLDNVVTMHPSPALLSAYKDLVLSTDAYGNLAPDAYLAALAIENGATLASNDQDFSRFERAGLKWFNPLADSGVAKGKRKKR